MVTESTTVVERAMGQESTTIIERAIVGESTMPDERWRHSMSVGSVFASGEPTLPGRTIIGSISRPGILTEYIWQDDGDNPLPCIRVDPTESVLLGRFAKEDNDALDQMIVVDDIVGAALLAMYPPPCIWTASSTMEDNDAKPPGPVDEYPARVRPDPDSAPDLPEGAHPVGSGDGVALYTSSSSDVPTLPATDRTYQRIVRTLQRRRRRRSPHGARWYKEGSR